MGRPKKITFLLLLIVLIAFAKVFSQSSNETFKAYTIDNGLSQSCVYSILQDRNGYMWFGTQAGVNKFNGKKFDILQYDMLDSNTISHNWIYGMVEDINGFIWVGTRSGLNKINIKTGKSKRYEYNQNNINSIQESKVYSILLDNEGIIWLRTINTLSKFDPKKEIFTHYDFQSDYFSFFERDYGWPIFDDGKGSIWFGSHDGLHVFNKSSEHFASFRHDESDPKSISDNNVTAIVEDKYKNLWIGTKNGLNKFNKKTKSFKKLFHDAGIKNSIIDNEIMSLFFDHNHFLWIGTANGLSKMTYSTESCLNFVTNQNRPGSLNHNTITAIFEDRSHNLWIGTDGGGVNKIDLKPKKFEVYNVINGLASNMISSIYEESKQVLWVGTWDNGLNIFNRVTGEITYFGEKQPDPFKISDDHIHALFKDKKGNMWVGSKKGVDVYLKDKKRFVPLSSYFEGDIKINTRVNSIIESKDGNIWVGSENGVYLLDLENKESKRFYNDTKDTNSISDNHVYSLHEDHNGDIWVGTFNGLNKISFLPTKVIRYLHDVNNLNSISSNSVYAIIQDRDKNLWMATSYGLNLYDHNKNSFSYYTTKQGLPSDELYGLVEDHNGNIWIMTNRGLSKFNKKDNSFKIYDKDDGLQGLEFNLGSSYVSTIDGEIFLGGIGGFNSFYPNKMRSNKYIPQIVITDIYKKSNNNSKNIPVEFNQEIVLSHQDYLLNIEFAALDFTNPEKNTYAYKIEGMSGQSDQWIHIGNRTFVPFPNMPAGTYTLTIIGSNNDQVWNHSGITIKVIKKPPFWKTIWAYIFYVLVVSSIVYYYISTRTRKLKEANQILREKQYAALEIAKQKEDLSRKNKAITDSINYAKRIQEAMMPSEYLFNKLLTDAFILYKPKDIVSGDFYWITERKNKIFIAAVDCTGHGVPGAFMSIIGYDLLKTITKEREIENPAEILNQLNSGVADTFSKNIVDGDVKDGMDISLCVIDKNNRTLEYAGAINPLFIIRNNRIIEIRGNRFSVGSTDNYDEQPSFESHVVPLRDTDMLYMFSDGYADQFGGPLGKKYKNKRFRHFLQTISSYPLKEQKKYLEDNINKWRGEMEQVDDILIIGIRVTKSLN